MTHEHSHTKAPDVDKDPLPEPFEHATAKVTQDIEAVDDDFDRYIPSLGLDPEAFKTFVGMISDLVPRHTYEEMINKLLSGEKPTVEDQAAVLRSNTRAVIAQAFMIGHYLGRQA